MDSLQNAYDAIANKCRKGEEEEEEEEKESSDEGEDATIEITAPEVMALACATSLINSHTCEPSLKAVIGKDEKRYQTMISLCMDILKLVFDSTNDTDSSCKR